MCVWVSVIELARRGFFRPGLHRGEAELLSEETSDWGITAPIRTAMRDSDGVLAIEVEDHTRPMAGLLTVCWPHTTEVRLHRVDDHAGFKWYFECPGSWSDPGCGRLVRHLYLPESPPGITPCRPCWRCSRCWGFAYRRFRPRDIHAATVRHLHSLDAMAADIARMQEIAVRELAELA
jgi:hypothetical protein